MTIRPLSSSAETFNVCASSFLTQSHTNSRRFAHLLPSTLRSNNGPMGRMIRRPKEYKSNVLKAIYNTVGTVNGINRNS